MSLRRRSEQRLWWLATISVPNKPASWTHKISEEYNEKASLPIVPIVIWWPKASRIQCTAWSSDRGLCTRWNKHSIEHDRSLAFKMMIRCNGFVKASCRADLSATRTNDKLAKTARMARRFETQKPLATMIRNSSTNIDRDLLCKVEVVQDFRIRIVNKESSQWLS